REVAREMPEIVVPFPDMELTTRRVLVMDHLPGRKMREFSRQASGDEMSRAGVAIMKVMNLALYRPGLFYSDPQPGSCLLGDGLVYVVDFGGVIELPQRVVDLNRRILLAAVRTDREEFARCYEEIGYVGDRAKFDFGAAYDLFRRTHVRILLTDDEVAITPEM